VQWSKARLVQGVVQITAVTPGPMAEEPRPDAAYIVLDRRAQCAEKAHEVSGFGGFIAFEVILRIHHSSPAGVVERGGGVSAPPLRTGLQYRQARQSP
jgi:hypothetical protein